MKTWKNKKIFGLSPLIFSISLGVVMVICVLVVFSIHEYKDVKARGVFDKRNPVSDGFLKRHPGEKKELESVSQIEDWMTFGYINFTFGIPLPATALVIAAGAFASQGDLDVHLVLITVFIACITGDHAIFHGITRYGHEGIEKIRLGKLLKTNAFLVVETKISQYASSTIFFSRWLFVSIGPLVNIVAGLAKVSKKQY